MAFSLGAMRGPYHGEIAVVLWFALILMVRPGYEAWSGVQLPDLFAGKHSHRVIQSVDVQAWHRASWLGAVSSVLPLVLGFARREPANRNIGPPEWRRLLLDAWFELVGALWRFDAIMLASSWWSTPVDAWASIVASLVVGWWIADWFSGLVHLLGDLYGPSWFEAHHRDPREFTKTSSGQRSYDLAAVSLAIRWLAPTRDHWLHLQPQAHRSWPLVWALGFGVYVTNEVHCLAHRSPGAVPRVVRLLQRMHIILDPRRHALHHTPPHDTQHAILCGWSWPVLRPLARNLFARSLRVPLRVPADTSTRFDSR